MTVTHTAVCTTKGCPAPRDPDWHIPWCQGVHECFGDATHQHVPKRSQGGKEIVACLCAGFHDRVDNGDYSNDVKDIPGRGRVYFALDLHGKTLIERTIGEETRPLSDGAEGGSSEAEHRSDGRRTPPGGDWFESSSPSAPSPSAKEEGDASSRSAASVGSLASGENQPGASLDSTDERGDSHTSSNYPGSLTHEQRVAIAQEIKDAEWGRQWQAGDTGNAWIAELGEEAEQYISDFGYVQESIANIMRVCEKIPPPFRNANLRFSHHVVVAGENREDVEMHLAECAEKEWSVAEFRRQRKGAKPRAKKWSLEELRELGQEWDMPDVPEGANVMPSDIWKFFLWLGER